MLHRLSPVKRRTAVPQKVAMKTVEPVTMEPLSREDSPAMSPGIGPRGSCACLELAV
ncbi:hypothetical protein LEMLEM_LOCUS1413 [Lemmus lemmus]